MPNLYRRNLLRASIVLAIAPEIFPLLGGCQNAKDASSKVDVSSAKEPGENAIVPKPIDEGQMMKVQYLEIVTPNVDAVCAQFAKVHGVTFGDPEPNLGGARAAKLTGGGILGVRGPMRANEMPVVRPYMLVDDIAASVTAAADAGAEIALPPMKLPGHGTCAIVIQGGIECGLWQL